MSFIASPIPSVGASGAIFGLVGVALAGTRVHNPILDRRARAIVPQLGMIVVINLAFGLVAGGGIDNAAHLGGLAAGLWLGLFVPPSRTRTLRDFWQTSGRRRVRRPLRHHPRRSASSASWSRSSSDLLVGGYAP